VFKLFGEKIQLLIGQTFHLDQLVAGGAHGADQFVQLHLKYARIAILRVLD